MNDSLATWLTTALAIGGAAVILLSLIGFLRMPDVYCRSHALGVGSTCGFTLLMLALWGDLGTEAAGFKVIAAIAFQLLTIPVSSHLLALQARRNRLPALGEPGFEQQSENDSH